MRGRSEGWRRNDEGCVEKLTPDMVRDTFLLREAREGIAAREAATRVDAGTLRKFRAHYRLRKTMAVIMGQVRWIQHLAMQSDERMPRSFREHDSITHVLSALADVLRAASGNAPFFAFASFVDPHHAYNPPSPYREMYNPNDMPPPVVRPSEREQKPPHYAGLYDMYKGWGEPARHRSQYYGEVTFIDDSVGRILRTLDELKLRDNTLIVFLSDHGDLLGDHYLYTKEPFHYRHCASVPLIVNMPVNMPAGDTGGKVVNGIVQEIDVMPTILDIVGVKAPDGVQGRSQKNVITAGGGNTGYDSALIEYGTSGVTDPKAGVQEGASVDLWTLRTDRWRMSYYPVQKTGELYDLEADPDEFRNIWNMTKFDSVQRMLKEQLLDRVLLAHDPLPRRENRY